MSEQENAEKQTPDVETQETEKKDNMKSFQCTSPKSDWHICFIAILSSVITVVIYHFVIYAVNEYCPKEEQPVLCSCHAESQADAPKKAPRKKGGKPGFLSKLTPEQREHLKTLKTKEERRAYLRTIFKDKAPRGKKTQKAAPQAK